jgi:hypothetical protein
MCNAAFPSERKKALSPASGKSAFAYVRIIDPLYAFVKNAVLKKIFV